jgi:hypothetical protein
MKEHKPRSVTIRQPGGGYLHIDRYIIPIRVPMRKEYCHYCGEEMPGDGACPVCESVQPDPVRKTG